MCVCTCGCVRVGVYVCVRVSTCVYARALVCVRVRVCTGNTSFNTCFFTLGFR